MSDFDKQTLRSEAEVRAGALEAMKTSEGFILIAKMPDGSLDVSCAGLSERECIGAIAAVAGRLV